MKFRFEKEIGNFRMNRKWLAAFFSVVLVFSSGFLPATAQEEAEDVESLYIAAGELSIEGKFEEAVQKYERLLDLAGDFLCEDYGPQAGGILFDYGGALVQLQQWDKAKAAFERCHKFDEEECKESKTPGKNERKFLSLFQWGFCEAQLGDHQKAIELYDQYINAVQGKDEFREELGKIRNAFKLRYGTSLVKVDRMEEGTAQISELFDNREEWQVAPQFLMQGLLEIGLGWGEAAKMGTPADRARIEASAHAFLDKNAQYLQVSPLDKFRFGILDRLKKLGFESSLSGMQTLALRYFSMIPTLDEVKRDIDSRLATVPGGTVPAAYQAVIDQVNEQAGRPVPPDVEMLRMVAGSYEKLGNHHAPRSIYWHLADRHPEIEQERRAEILHEAARFSTMVGDYPAAQFFGETFNSEMPADHSLRNNVATFMLQSLFTAREFEQVVTICESVRERFEAGDLQRELADSLYGMALYSLSRFEDAIEPMDGYVKDYPEGQNREMVLYYRASVRLILSQFRKGAEQLEEFLNEFPESAKYHDLALFDLALARFNLEDYSAAISVVERLEEEKPDSKSLDRALNIKADSYFVQADDAPDDDKRAELRKKSLETFLQAVEVGERLLAGAGEEPDGAEMVHKESVAEALAKATDIHVVDLNCDEAIKLYDRFFPPYVGTRFEPQISVYTIECLGEAGRAEDGLGQLEKMIIQLGNADPETQDLQLLREAIGSYSDASVTHRSAEKTLESFDNFPGLDQKNVVLLTWLKMQKVIVLQQMRAAAGKESPEYAKLSDRIDAVFKELELIEVKDLSEIALKMIGDYFSGSDNPFLAVSYYEELLIRENPEADKFKASADLNLGRIETRSPDAEKLRQARERFVRIIDIYKDKELTPEAWLERGRVASKMERWDEAAEAFIKINQNKRWLKAPQRAESNYGLGVALEAKDDIGGALKAYLGTWVAYGNMPTWTARAFEKWLELGFKDADLLEDPIQIREKKVEYYKILKTKLFQWQKWDFENTEHEALRRLQVRLPGIRNELMITPEQENEINAELGISQPEN